LIDDAGWRVLRDEGVLRDGGTLPSRGDGEGPPLRWPLRAEETCGLV